MKKSLIVLLVAAAAVLFFSFSAGAACVQTGTVQYSYATTAGQYIYVAPSTNGPYTSIVYTYFIPNAYSGIASVAAGARNAHQTVTVYGSATSCPTTGTVRPAGTATQIKLLMKY